jgi:hypothetical protein
VCEPVASTASLAPIGAVEVIPEDR